MPSERSRIAKEVHELGQQDSRNLRTSLILLGIILSSITFLESSNTELINTLKDSRLVLASISFLFASISTSVIISTLRWLEDGTFSQETSTKKLREKARNLTLFVFISRLTLTGAIFFMSLGVINQSNWLTPIETIILLVPALLVALLASYINRKNIWREEE